MRKRKELEQAKLRILHTNSNGAERQRARREYNTLFKELLEARSYYRRRRHFLDGIKIVQNQISFDEFEALLYFAKVTGEDRTKWFYDFASVYPWITYAWDKHNAA